MKRPLQALLVGAVMLTLYRDHYDLLWYGVCAFIVGSLVITLWRSV